MSIDFTPTVKGFSGFADLYDRYRPALAVREAVGPDMALMLDPFHYYSHEEALALGRDGIGVLSTAATCGSMFYGGHLRCQ
jgi:hypothetical protein